MAVEVDVWQFAVGIDELRRLGLSESDCRRMICAGYVEHGEETTQPEDDQRHFRRVRNLSMSHRSCFVLTSVGVSLAEYLAAQAARHHSDASSPSAAYDPKNRPVPLVPEWDVQRHELRLGRHLIKRFKWPAVNQKTILAAFQEESWPTRIDDPLPPQPSLDPKCRLHDTIKCLNRNQTCRLVRFGGDGTGEGILWSLTNSERFGAAS